MRVTFGVTYDRMNYTINSKKEAITHLSSAISSGKQLQKPSDDPYGWGQAYGIKGGLREIQGYEDNIDFATGWNNATESTLRGIYDLVGEARDLAISSVKATSQEERTINAGQIDKIIEEAVNLANTKYGDRYLFSVNGTKAPFELDNTGSGSLPRVLMNDVDVEGTPAPDLTPLSETVGVRVAKGQLQTINRDGAQVFFNDPSDSADPKNNLFVLLRDLRDAIKSGEVDKIQTGQQDMETAQSNLSAQISLVGVDLSSLDRQKNILESTKLERQSTLADTEEGDIISAITQLQQKQTTFQAALQVTGMLDKLNLLQYL